jgi:mRNA-degrading endonuclease RelE of RelBE toxin-antitoxin system
MARASYRLVFADQLFEHIRAIPSKHHRSIQETLESLLQQPATPSRNRKALRVPNALNATWEQRFGEDNEFRAFYQILPDETENTFTVFVIALGIKEGNQLRIGLEEVTL